jgi:hypothetical protein
LWIIETRIIELSKSIKNNVQHSIRLKQELRKLREEDIMKVKERKKRLEMIKKNNIIEKQEKDQQGIKSIKSLKDLISRKMVEEDIKDLQHKDELACTLLHLTKGNLEAVKKTKFNSTITQELKQQEEVFE